MREWDYQYSVLNKNTLDEPIAGILVFTRIDSLYNVRQGFFDLLAAAMTSTLTEEDTSESKSQVFLLYSTVLEAIELCYRIQEMIDNNELSFTYNNK
jgi:hypothetical protein